MPEQWDGRPPGDAAGRDGWHWLNSGWQSGDPREVIFWCATTQRWGREKDGPQPNPMFYRYLGPCLTPAEAAALRAERDAAVAALAECREVLRYWEAHADAYAIAITKQADQIAQLQAERDAALAEAAQAKADHAATRFALGALQSSYDSLGGKLQMVKAEAARLQRMHGVAFSAACAAQAEAARLREKARNLDAALSGLWPKGPEQIDSANYLGSVDIAWGALRAELRAALAGGGDGE